MADAQAGKSWPAEKAKRFKKECIRGRTYYTVLDISQRVAPYEDRQLYREWVFEGTSFFGWPATKGGHSADMVFAVEGTIYADRPAGIRPIAGPSPQMEGPLGDDIERILDADEITHLRKRLNEARADHRSSGRSGWL